MKHVPINDPHALSTKIELRDGMRTLCVYTDLDLNKDNNGLLNPDTLHLVDRASEARDAYHPGIKRIDFIRLRPIT